MKAVETTCNSCSVCSSKLNGSYDVVKLTTNILDYPGTCITFGANNTEFDCQDHRIDGDDSGSDQGILIHQKIGSTIQNCIIEGFSTGIGVSFSTDINILNSNISYNSFGVQLNESINNTLMFNTISYNSVVGVYHQLFQGISGTTISNNNIYSNGYNVDNNAPSDVTAGNNWWGTTNCSEVAETIFDYYDVMNFLRGILYFEPILNAPYPAGLPITCADSDDDGVPDYRDNCPAIHNPGQENSDIGTFGDACDNCWYVSYPDQNDTDENCPAPPYFLDPKCGDACEYDYWVNFTEDLQVDETNDENFKPSVAVDDFGHIYVAWEYCRLRVSYVCHISDLYLGISEDDGQTFDNYVVAEGDTDFNCTPPFCLTKYPSIVVENNTIYIAYININSSNNSSSRNLIVSHSSDPTSPSNIFTHLQANNDSLSPVVGSASLAVVNDTVYVTWNNYEYNNNHIYFAKSVDGGHSFGENVQVDDTDGEFDRNQPSMDVLGDSIYIAWKDTRQEIGPGYHAQAIYFSKSENTGNSFGADVWLFEASNVSSGYLPDLVVDKFGNIYVVWIHQLNDIYNPIFRNYGSPSHFFSRSFDGGLSFSEPKRINNPIFWNWYHSLSINKLTGVLDFVWSANVGTHQDIFYTRSYDQGSSFMPILRVDDAPADAQSIDSSSTIDMNGMVYAVWQDWRNGEQQIFFSKSFCSMNTDNDAVCDGVDNCPIYNPDQSDIDGDEVGDVCDNCWYEPNPDQNDTDGDCSLPPYTADPRCGDDCEAAIPIVTIHSPEAKNYQMEKLWLKVTSNIPVDSWEYEINGGGRIGFTPNITINAAQCSNNLTVYAIASGQEGSSNVQFNALKGDVDGDKDVDIFDLVLCAGAYGTNPTMPKWKPECDIVTPPDGDGQINIFDIVAMAGNYGKKC